MELSLYELQRTDRYSSLTSNNSVMKILDGLKARKDRPRSLTIVERQYKNFIEELFPNRYEYLGSEIKVKRYGTRYNKWNESLTEEERDAINDYTSPTYYSYRYINYALRTFGGDDGSNLIFEDNSRAIDLISRALNKTKVSSGVIAFRGTERVALGEHSSLEPDQLIGKVIQEKGFLSTFLDFPGLAIFREREVFMIIKVPEGIKGAYIKRGLGCCEEHELLVDKGQKMIIQDAFEEQRKSGKKQIVLICEIIKDSNMQ